MNVKELPQWQAAHAAMLRPKRDGETIYEVVIRQTWAAVRMDEIREAFESGRCPTCRHQLAEGGTK